MQTLEDLLRSPPTYPDGLVGRNVSLAGDHEASRAANDSYPIFGGGGGGSGVGYNAEEGGAAATATANATQTNDCEQVTCLDSF